MSSNTDKKIFSVIPAFNEEKTIGNVILGLKQYVDNIVVVNDASDDKTAIIAQNNGVIVLTHDVNQGYDKSLDDGFKMAADIGADIIFTFDADNQHDAKDVPKLIEPIIDGKADITVGKRPKYARITEHILGIISRRKAGIDDPLCGFKAYNIEVYKDIGYFDKISSIGTQLLFEGVKKNYRAISIDININEREDNSRFGARMRGNWKIVKAIFNLFYYVWL